MKIQHAKSPCCEAHIQRFGKRRRRCAKCHSTWRIRKKKRGRKCIRTNPALAHAYLNKERPSIRTTAQQKGCGKDSIQLALRKSRDAYIAREQPQWGVLLSDHGALIAIADAIWYHIQKEFYTIYTILLRPIEATEAVICLPVVLQGREDLKGWEHAFDTLPKSIKNRIIALVCDGATSLVALA